MIQHNKKLSDESNTILIIDKEREISQFKQEPQIFHRIKINIVV